MVFIISCGCNETLTVFTLNEQDKDLVPYKLNDALKWTDNNETVYNGIVNEIKDRYSEREKDCNTVKFNELIHNIQFDDFKYTIILDKRSNNLADLIINAYVGDEKKSFIKRSITLDDFTTTEFNGETYENAVLIKQSVLDDMPFGHLVYSKTNGIEFILFEDGTWYKRVE